VVYHHHAPGFPDLDGIIRFQETYLRIFQHIIPSQRDKIKENRGSSYPRFLFSHRNHQLNLRFYLLYFPSFDLEAIEIPGHVHRRKNFPGFFKDLIDPVAA